MIDRHENTLRVPFVGIIDTLERDILLVLEQSIEFWSQAMESQFGQQELNVCSDQWSIAYLDQKGIIVSVMLPTSLCISSNCA